MLQAEGVIVRRADPGTPEAVEILSAYWRDIVGRYHGRTATDAEVGQALSDYPSDDLAPPMGVFLIATDEHGVVGCAGLRWAVYAQAELVRVFVAARGRGRGTARALLGAAEEAARTDGRTAITAEVRADLVEAQTLYEACGYADVPAFSTGRFADVWLRKHLTQAPDATT